MVEKLVLLTGMGKYDVIPWARTTMHFEDAQKWGRGTCFPGLGKKYL